MNPWHPANLFDHAFESKLTRCCRDVASLWLIFAVLNFPFLSQLILTVDNEIMANWNSDLAWIERGRWGHYFIGTYLFPQPVLAFFPLAFYGLAAAASFIIFLRTVDRKSLRLADILLFPLFVGFPTVLFLQVFSANIIGQGWALLLAAIAAFVANRVFVEAPFFSKNNFIRSCAVMLAGATCISFYQSNVCLLVVALLVPYIYKLDDRDFNANIKALSRVAFDSIGSIVLYLAIDSLLLKIYSPPKDTYVEHFVDLHALHHFSSVIHNILTQISQVYLGTDAVFGTSSMFISMFLCLSVLTLGWVIVRRKFRSQSNKLLLLLILFSIIVLPFVPSIISGGALPIRSLAAVPICVWAICFATSHFASCFRSLPWLICLVLADLNLSYIYCYNQTQTLIATQNDRQLAQAIIDRCSQVSKEFEPNSRIYALITYGAAAYHLPYKHRSESTLGAMVFEWDGGSPERQVNYYKVIGMPCFQLAKPTEKQKYRKKLEAMPVWPRAGSVEVTEDVVLVKLGSNCSRYWSTF